MRVVLNQGTAFDKVLESIDKLSQVGNTEGVFFKFVSSLLKYCSSMS